MSVAGLRRLIPVGWKGSVRALVDLLAEHHAFEASASQRDAIARLAEAFLASPTLDDERARDLKFDLADPSWKTRAEAAARLASAGAWTPWSVAGSAGVSGAGASPPRDDARLASAVAVAVRETLVPETSARHERLRGPATAALANEADGAFHWDEAARPLVAEFAANARAHGAGRAAAALKALSAAAHLKGRAMRSAGAEPFLLGAAASSLLHEDDEEREDGAPTAMEELARVIAALNDARAAVWDDADPETTRLMGAAASFAVFGRGTVAPPRASASADFAHAPPDVLRRYAGLTAADAADAIDDEAADPRLAEDRRRRLESLASSLRRHPAAHAVSCAEASGIEGREVRAAAPSPGMRLYRAAIGGRRRPLLCEGKNGRAVRCRAVASSDGAHVGYLAYDALSREFGGRPLYAVYATDGARYGYAWADGRAVVRRGEPEQGFRTAPERIPV